MVRFSRNLTISPSFSAHLLLVALSFYLLIVSSFTPVKSSFQPLIQLPHFIQSFGFWSNVNKVSVDDHGAKGDGVTDDTEAFRSAWEVACSTNSRSILKIPAGKVYLVRPIDFGGPCQSKVIFLVSGNITAPKDPHVWDGLNPHKWLYFHGMDHLVIRGGGTINGMGNKWWEQSCKVNSTNPCRHAPTVSAATPLEPFCFMMLTWFWFPDLS